MCDSQRLLENCEKEREEMVQLYREGIARIFADVTEPRVLEYFYYFIHAKLGKVLPEEVLPGAERS